MVQFLGEWADREVGGQRIRKFTISDDGRPGNDRTVVVHFYAAQGQHRVPVRYGDLLGYALVGRLGWEAPSHGTAASVGPQRLRRRDQRQPGAVLDVHDLVLVGALGEVHLLVVEDGADILIESTASVWGHRWHGNRVLIVEVDSFVVREVLQDVAGIIGVVRL